MSPTGAAPRAPGACAGAARGLVLLAAALLLYAPPLAVLGAHSDYAVHAREAQRFVEAGRTDVPVPAPLFAALTAGVQTALRAPGFLGAALLVGWLAHLALAGVLYREFRAGAPARPPAACLALALATTLVAPIHLPTLAEQNLYFGYIGLATYHNPSATLLRPLALLVFARALLGLAERPASTPRQWLGTALLCALAALAKPSYSIALLPALALYAGVRAARVRGGVDWPLLLLGIAAPSGAVLAGAYLYTYSGAQAPHAAGSPSAIVFAPLQAMRAVSPSGLAPKLLLSVAFPALVAALYAREARRSTALRLGWLTFGVAAGYGYLLAESGPRAAHGNFLWSGQIALFVLFAASVRFLLTRAPAARDARLGICATAYALHLASGLVWYAVQILPALAPGAPPLRAWF